MAWISVHDGVTDHPKTRKLARLLGCNRHEAIGILVSLWQWCIRNADRDGRIQDATEDEIADGIIYGKPGRTLLNALVESGWVDAGSDGAYTLHDWDDWQSNWFKYLDKTESDRRRRREERTKSDFADILPESRGKVAGKSRDILPESRGKVAGNNTIQKQDLDLKDQGQVHMRKSDDLRDSETATDLNDESDNAADEANESLTGETAQGENEIRSKTLQLSKKQAELFKEFWKAYPKKKSKGQAERTWKKLKADDALLAEMFKAIERTKQSRDWKEDGGKYIPHPATWLNARGWEDEPDPPDPPGGREPILSAEGREVRDLGIEF
ncbi:MAG: hypothetical protein LBK57_03695 [Clostridiales Family XIII bacterium]|nr:hypothetical protein [Clostridiales Family XIII bacterium]